MKYRIIINSVHFYSNDTAIKRGVGDNISVNAAILSAHESLMKMRKENTLKPIGLSGFWNGHSVQIDIM